MFKNWIGKKNKRKIKSTKKSSSVSIPEVHKTCQIQNNGPQPPVTKQRGSPSDRPFEGQTRGAAKGYREELHQRQARGATKFYDEKLQQRYIRDAAKPSNEVLNQGHTRGAAKPYDEELHQRQIRDAATPYHEVLHQGHTRGAAKPYQEELYQEQVRDAAKHYYEELHDRHTMGAAKPYDEELHPEQTRSAAKPCREELRQGQTRVAAKHYYEDLHHASLRSSEGQNGAAIPQVSTSAQSVVLLKNQKPIGKTVSQQILAKQQKAGVDSLLPPVPLLQESPSSNSEKGVQKSLQQLTVDLHHHEPLGQKSKTSQGQNLKKNNSQHASAAQQPRAPVHQEPSQNFQREKLHFTPDTVSAEQIDIGCMMNLKFYQAEIPCQPHGIYIDDIHKWRRDYERLERDHRYIQWLFPIPESHGRNPEAFQLTPHEAEEIKKDKLAFERFLLSYEMMLNFYGMKLDRVTGQLSRSRNYESRFAHLNRSRHNYMRITRILICLGEFGLEHYQRQFIRFLLNEAFVEHTLDGTQDSCFKFWIPTVRDDGEREKLEKEIDQLYSRVNRYRRNNDKLRKVSK